MAEEIRIFPAGNRQKLFKDLDDCSNAELGFAVREGMIAGKQITTWQQRNKNKKERK